MSNSLRPHGLQHRLSCPSVSPGVGLNSYPWSQSCHPRRKALFSYSQSFPASGAFPVSWLFTSHGQSIEVSASVLVHPMSIQGWFPLGLTNLLSLLLKWLSRIFSSATVQKHQFFSTQLMLGAEELGYTYVYTYIYIYIYTHT